MKLISALLLPVLLATGCATRDPHVWYQPGKTISDLQRDWAKSCIESQKAMLRVPPPLVIAENGFAAGMAMRARSDAIKAAERLAPLHMQAKGYLWVRRSTVPANDYWFKPD